MPEKFTFSYSADKNEEIRKIREKYAVKTDEENELLQDIRKLDFKIETPGKIAGICWGLLFAFMFGTGIFLCIKYQVIYMYVFGGLLALIGFIGMSFSPKITDIIFEARKEKYGKQMLELTDKALGIKKI